MVSLAQGGQMSCVLTKKVESQALTQCGPFYERKYVAEKILSFEEPVPRVVHRVLQALSKTDFSGSQKHSDFNDVYFVLAF